jgi:hypothetical protein
MAEERHPEQPPHQQHEGEVHHRHLRDHNSPRPAQEQRPQEPASENLDAAEDEEERRESRHRTHGGGHRGGRPVKKVYEEWANDPYCE